jgi:hypothetical protein
MGPGKPTLRRAREDSKNEALANRPLRVHRSLGITAAAIGVLVACALWASPAHAYPTWNPGCTACHGDFNSGTYVSLSDNTSWGTNLMQGHINFMGGGACNICHQPPGGTPRAPVYVGLSAGITAYSPIACLGCHGRGADASGACVDGDPATIDPANCGMGAGLRLRHANSGVPECADCHTAAVPAAEDVAPPFYFSDASRPNKPLDPCNAAPAPGNENKFGSTGLDNDGNGFRDQADPNCQPLDLCAGFTPTACSVPGTQGACAVSQSTCDPDTGAITCPQTVQPTAETCNNVDDDCDGTVDDGIAPVTITCGTGACQVQGQQVCVGGQVVDQCTPGQPGVEVCNNLDDNCNGVIDDIVSASTTCGVGACASTGQMVCQNGAPVDTCTPLQPGTEGPGGSPTCADGVDNDCDTLTDAADPGCVPTCVPQPEVCDGVDNDCNDVVDDGILPADITCGVGACQANGQRVCVNGALADQCTPLQPGTEGPFGDPTCTDGIDNNCNGLADAADSNCQAVCTPTGPEVCDGVDNDCNDVIDDVAPVPTTCGIGACASTGEVVCQNGAPVDTCVALPAGVEQFGAGITCSDNIDNDCDSLVDAADPGCTAGPIEQACFDGQDDDGDGLVDCADPDCADAVGGTCDTGLAGSCAAGQGRCVAGAAACVQLVFPQPEICADGVDNDCDGVTDGADPDCQAPPVEQACFDGQDDDGDGLIDCADPDCADAVGGTCDTGLAGSCAAGQTLCVDGAAACVQLVFPQREVCADGVDNDCDGVTDGADPDCQKVQICHVTPREPSKGKLITVGADAVPVHFQHGDYFPDSSGSCDRERERKRRGKEKKKKEREEEREREDR